MAPWTSPPPAARRPLSLLALGAGTIAVVACAPSPHVTPYEMTAPEHERAASTHAAEARAEQASFDPDAATLFPCMLLGMRGAKGDGSCWDEMENPTKEHLAAAEKHRQLAEEHREASTFLRERARLACEGVPTEDRNPARLVLAVDGSEAIVAPGAASAGPSGVTVAVRVVPGVTRPRLQASLDCELARLAAFGSPHRPRAIGAPRAPITATVVPTARGFAVELRSEDPATNARLVDDARSAFTPPASTTTEDR
jgi:hypothetical protein